MQIIRRALSPLATVAVVVLVVWGAIALLNGIDEHDARERSRALAVTHLMPDACGVDGEALVKEYRRFVSASRGKWEREYLTVSCDGERVVARSESEDPLTCDHVLFENETSSKWNHARFRLIGCGLAAEMASLPTAHWVG